MARHVRKFLSIGVAQRMHYRLATLVYWADDIGATERHKFELLRVTRRSFACDT